MFNSKYLFENSEIKFKAFENFDFIVKSLNFYIEKEIY